MIVLIDTQHLYVFNSNATFDLLMNEIHYTAGRYGNAIGKPIVLFIPAKCSRNSTKLLHANIKLPLHCSMQSCQTYLFK